MRKKSITLLCVLCLSASTPLVALAETIDQKIDASTQRIEILKQAKDSAEQALVQINTDINALTTKVEETLAKKNELEKKLNELNGEIRHLEEVIAKRGAQINEQARTIQIDQSTSRYLDVLLESESISEAITRTVAYTRLVSANNDIMAAQKDDQVKLEETKTELDTSLAEVETLTKELKTQQDEMVTKQSQQVALAAEVASSLTSEEQNNSKLVSAKAKAVAEAKKAEQARQAKAAADEKARQIAQAKREQEASKKEQIAQENGSINTQVMPGEEPTSNNNTPNNDNQVIETPSSGGGFQMPTSNFVVTSGFGGRVDPTGFSGNHHDGIDLAGPAGTPIVAARAGEVVSAYYDGSGGNLVIIKHDNGYYTYYMHMSQTYVSAGQQVSAGTGLGAMGTTGNSTGVHLHFGISTGLWSGFMNPAPFLGL